MLAMTSTSSHPSAGGDIGDAGEWLRQLESVETAVDECSNQINDAQSRGLGNRQKRVIGKKVADSRDTLTRLERSLHNMERNPIKFKIGEGEIARRKGLLASVRSSNERLDDELTNGSGRGSLLGGARGKGVSLADESVESQQVSNAQLLQSQKSALSMQDEKLDGILDGVTRLKVMSGDINQELDLHANLLNELDSAVDSTDARLQRNTKRVELVTEQSGGCCGLLIMAVLFILIVLLLVTNWGCHVFKPSKC